MLGELCLLIKMILAIESSCDESALALFSEQEGILGEWVYSQLDLHREYGGVVPSLASREHLKAFGPLLKKALELCPKKKISKIAVTYGPGLAGCLALGISLAKALALSLKVPLIGVNHLRGHVYSPFINLHKKNPIEFKDQFQKIFPHLGLIVSGGNTILFEIDSNQAIRIIAQTVDDAAGEALDKGAKLLGMPYPGGALIEKTAVSGNPQAIKFPQACLGREEMRFSFSGLKTSLRYRLEKMTDLEVQGELPDICASYQEAVVQALIKKTQQALDSKTYVSIGLSGGVSNNKRLRECFADVGKNYQVPHFIAEQRHTGDNAAMIAFAAFVDVNGTVHDGQHKLTFNPSIPLA